MKEIDKGVCVQGFKASGWRNDNYGIAMILSDVQANCALALTFNRIKAAPLLISERHVKKGKVRGIVANSGNANAYTGKRGLEDAEKMCSLAAKELGIKKEDFIVASTGIIGRKLDLKIIEEGIKKVSKGLDESKEASLRAANAIMTTDKFPKMMCVKTTLKDGTEIELGGIAKGAGMIAPSLHTMLCFITTNAYVPQEKIKRILMKAVNQSFNMTVIDGDMSPNDLVAFLANGRAGNEDVDENLQKALNYVCTELAKMLAKNAEGATKFLEVKVEEATTIKDARRVAKAIAGSNLVKSAIFGEDPNWGRIVAALGYSGAKFDPDKISLYLNEICLIEKGEILAFERAKLEDARKSMKNKEIEILVKLHTGNAKATAFGCDLTPEYIKINAKHV
jgi:glutamate N-acetyltransferase/amino-acid N-acetyltransferase